MAIFEVKVLNTVNNNMDLEYVEGSWLSGGKTIYKDGLALKTPKFPESETISRNGNLIGSVSVVA